MRHHHKAIVSSLLLAMAMPAITATVSDQRDAYQRAQQQQALQLKQRLPAPQIARQPAISRYRPKPKPLIKPADITPVYQPGHEPKPTESTTFPAKVRAAPKDNNGAAVAFRAAQQQQRLELEKSKTSKSQVTTQSVDNQSPPS